MSIRILLADDHNMMREGLRSLIEKQSDMEVVAEAEDGQTAVGLAQKLSPDVAIMDIAMPELNGIGATRQITARAPGVKVLALSTYSDRQLVAEMFKAGASGYLLKKCAFRELTSAIKAVAAGQTYLSPEIASIVVEGYLRYLTEAGPSAFSILTRRELEVLELLSEGKSTRQIACCLNVGRKTVDTHRRNVMKKLGIHSVAELTKYAIRVGLTTLDPGGPLTG